MVGDTLAWAGLLFAAAALWSPLYLPVSPFGIAAYSTLLAFIGGMVVVHYTAAPTETPA